MPNYIFEAVDAKGNRIKAQLHASSQAEAIAKIRAKGLKPTKISQSADAPPNPISTTTTKSKTTPPPVNPPGVPPSPSTVAPPSVPTVAPPAPVVAKPKRRALFYIGGITRKQIVQFTGQFATLLEAGLPIVRALKVLGNQQKPGPFQNTILSVAEDVETGGTLSDSMAKHPRAFDKLYVNMIRAGEAGGVLDTILRRLADYMEKMQRLKQKIISASVYPAVVMTAAIAAVIFIMIVVVPTFVKIFEEQKLELPAVTSMLITVSLFLKKYWPVIILVPVGIYIILYLWGKTRSGRMSIDTFKLNMPLFGTLVKKTAIARFCRTLGTLLQSGVPILDALAIVKGTAGNEVIATAVEQVHSSIKEGESIAGPLAQSKVFDDMVINMIEVGEETGELDKMLIKIADTYDYEVDVAISGLMSMLEPLLILFLGGAIGFIVISIFLPLITLLQKLGQRTGGGPPGP
jgi:type IV pilus assembly protein PilC